MGPLLIRQNKTNVGGRKEGKLGPWQVCRVAGDDEACQCRSEPVGELRAGECENVLQSKKVKGWLLLTF